MVYFLETLLRTILLTNEYVRPKRMFIRLNDVILRFSIQGDITLTFLYDIYYDKFL